MQASLFQPTETKSVTLRPYQLEAKASVLAEWYEKNVQATFLVMSTGTGKTETFTGILAEEREKGRLDRALILAHRKELVEQPRDRIEANWSNKLPIPGIVMGDKNQASSQIVCATVQTLQSERRLAQMMQFGSFSHVIIDEAHHASAPMYQSLLKTIKEDNPNVKILGVTATPSSDMATTFQSLAYKITLKDAIRKLKCLSPFVGMMVSLDLKIDKEHVRTNGDDFSDSQLATVMEASNTEELIYQTWKKYAAERQTMVFAASVAHAEQLCRYFTEQGESAAVASGQTDKAERAKIVRRYKAGQIQILFNCAVWTEGFDAPETSCVLMARPTMSTTFYLQAVGRGLRLSPGKENCIVIDFVPQSDRSLVLSGDLLGTPRQMKESIEKAQKAGVLLGFNLDGEDCGINSDPDKVLVKIFDLLANNSQYKWTFDGVLSSCNVGKGCNIAIVSPEPERLAKAQAMKSSGNWCERHQRLYDLLSTYRVYVINGSRVELIYKGNDYDAAHMVADEFIDNYPSATYAGKKARWRDHAPSPQLQKFAEQLKVFTSGATAGQLSQAITHKQCRNALARISALAA